MTTAIGGMQYAYTGIVGAPAVGAAVVVGLTTRLTVAGASKKPLPSTQYVPADSPLVGMVTGIKAPLESVVAARLMDGIAAQEPEVDAYT